MFLEKFAKLKSDVNQSGNSISIEVFDDEQSETEPVMYLDGVFRDSSSENKGIYVNLINFDDNLFFSMPENRQEACASVLLKKFLKWYNQSFGRNTDDWLPVYAEFANYKLQEKFKNAVEKGIFPPESLDLSSFTNEENWKEDQKHNKDNRKEQYDETQDLLSKFNGNVKLENDEDGTPFLIGAKVSDIQSAFGGEKIQGTIRNNGDVVFVVPENLTPEFGFNYGFNLEGSTIKFIETESYSEQQEILDTIAIHSNKVLTAFDTITVYIVGEHQIPADQILTYQLEEEEEPVMASNKRLIRKIHN